MDAQIQVNPIGMLPDSHPVPPKESNLTPLEQVGLTEEASMGLLHLLFSLLPPEGYSVLEVSPSTAASCSSASSSPWCSQLECEASVTSPSHGLLSVNIQALVASPLCC